MVDRRFTQFLQPTIRLAFSLATLFGFASTCQLSADDYALTQHVPEIWQEDAELTDVFFLNDRLGWAVGQHGICLRTVDGGLTWQRSVTRVPLNQGQNRVTRDMKSVLDQVRSETLGGADNTTSTDYVVGHSPAVRLESVSFLNERQGWAVGGYELPYVPISRGVVFRTTDGGESWKPISGVPLPRLFRVQFPQAYSGWALGYHSELLRTNVLFSNDLGQSFANEITTPRIDMVDGEATADGWIGIDRTGQLQRVGMSSNHQPLTTDGRTDRLRTVRMQDALVGWAVGDRGRILMTQDGGKSWQAPAWLSRYPSLSAFDLAAICFSQGRVWLVGNPGTIAFCYDQNRSELLTFATGCRVPLNRIFFVNSSLGIAVGAMGTILRTDNGGQNWAIVRSVGTEVSQLNVAFHSADVCFESLARWSDEDGYLSAVAVLELSDVPLPSLPTMQQAIQRLGTSTFVTLPVRPNPSTGSTGQQPQILERLVRTIRQFRPRVIVSPMAAAPVPGIGYLDCQEILDQAIRAAANRTQFPEHWQTMGLDPWQVDRLAVGSPSASGQVCELNTRQFLPRTGEMLDDRVAISRALVGLSLAGLPLQNFQVTRYSAASINASNLYAGLSEIGRRLPQRPLTEIRRGNLSNVQDLFFKQKQIQSLLQASAANDADLRLWRQQVNHWTMAANRDSAGLWLAQLAEAYLQAGRLSLAEHSLDYLCQYFPDHALAPAAQWWLANYAISSEVEIAKHSKRDAPLVAKSNLPLPANVANSGNVRPASREETDDDLDLELSAEELAKIDKLLEEDRPKLKTVQQVIENNGVKYTVWIPVEESAGGTKVAGEVVTAEQLEAEANSANLFDESQRHELPRQRLLQLRQRFPDLANADGVRLLEARLLMRTGEGESALKLMKQIAQDRGVEPAFQQAAQQEIKNLQNSPDKLTWQVRRLDFRPRLDGQLDDWNQASSDPGFWNNVSISPASSNRPTVSGSPGDKIAMCYDDEFLFVAIQCQKISKQQYNHPVLPRTADADLSPYDRVEISFDSDRDHTWPFRLGVDCRGWTFDYCGVAVDWNPQWFVAKSEDETSWTVEAAIPWQHLAILPPSSGALWHCGAARFPSWQSDNLWSLPAPSAWGTLQIPLLLPPHPSDNFFMLRFE